MSSSMSGFGGMGASGANLRGNVVPKGYKQGQLQQFTPEQMQLFQSMFSQVQPGSYLSKLAGGDEATFSQIEAPALRQFGQLQGDIASRFSQQAPGALSARGGSGFKNTINTAASDFAQDLQARRMGLQRQAIQDLMGISQDLLGQRPYEQFLIKQQPRQSGWAKALGIGLPIAGAALGGIFGGPAGASIGGSLGGMASSGFSPTQWGG